MVILENPRLVTSYNPDHNADKPIDLTRNHCRVPHQQNEGILNVTSKPPSLQEKILITLLTH